MSVHERFPVYASRINREARRDSRPLGDASVEFRKVLALRGPNIWANSPVIDAWVVAPEARGTAASLMMVEAATRNGLDARAQRFRISCADNVQDTIKLAERGGAVLTATKLKFSLPLPAARPGEGDQAA